MMEQSFSLIPFPAPAIPDVIMQGAVARQNHLLTLHYLMAGDIADIYLPSPSAAPSRAHELWKATCFEFFLAIAAQPQYWEFNVSPCGDWNVYRMDAYRRVGFGEETAVQQLQLEVQKSADRFALRVTVDLRPVFRTTDFLNAGIAAILQTKDGQETYWALTHPASHADFHRRESFILSLAGQTQPSGQSAPGG
jgi:hypothetical protein